MLTMIISVLLKFQKIVKLKALSLLKAMLEKDPLQRISAKDALNHPVFHNLLSKSPLIDRKRKDTDSLLKHDELTKK